MRKSVAIVAGGNSSERPVSLLSAEGLYSFIDKERYEVYIVEIVGLQWTVRLPEGETAPVDRSDFSFIYKDKRVKFDFAYITIHGAPGEDGTLQGYFEMMGMPYSGCGVLASALTNNKYICNHFLKIFFVASPISVMLGRGYKIPNRIILSDVRLPCIVKPNLGGSSFGISKVNRAHQLQPAIRKAFRESDEVIIEQFLTGTEVTCGSYWTKKGGMVFPVTEIVTDNEFFDYDAKYNGQSQEITPARIDEKLTKSVQSITEDVCHLVGCLGFVRADYIITKENRIYLLELNTNPGMTGESIIPKQVRAAGLDMKKILTEIIEDKISININK